MKLRTNEGDICMATSTGLPQGDPMSPTLFNIFTNNLHDISDKNSILFQYADDFNLIAYAKTKKKLDRLVREKIKEIFIKFSNNGMSVSLEKSNIMFINQQSHLEQIIVNNETINVVDCINYLGVEIDKNLRFHKQCTKVCNNLSMRINAFGSFARIKNNSHPKTLNIIFNAIIMGYTNYSLTLVANACKTNVAKIDKKVNLCLRKINGLTRTTPLNTLSAIAAKPPLNCEILKIMLKYILRIKLKNISTFQFMMDNLSENIYDIQDCEETLINNKYSALEKCFIIHYDMIKNWPHVKKYDLKAVIEIYDSINSIPCKSKLPPNVIKSLSLAKISEYSELKVFTDGSFSNESFKGIGVFSDSFELSKQLVHSTSSTSCELNAIKYALEECKLKNIPEIVIFTDSKSSCSIIQNAVEEKECETIVYEILSLCEDVTCKIQWIPSHVGITGNEKADKLAKEACLYEIYSNELITSKDAIKQIQNIVYETWKNWYHSQVQKGKGCKATKFFDQIHNKQWYLKFNLELNGTEIKLVNRLISGHDYSPKYLKLMNLSESENCDKCEVISDALHHILKDCKKY
jgi:ribonuclease HI